MTVPTFSDGAGVSFKKKDFDKEIIDSLPKRAGRRSVKNAD
jgi:hypothetical protein